MQFIRANVFSIIVCFVLLLSPCCNGLRLAPIFAKSSSFGKRPRLFSSFEGRLTARIVPSEFRDFRRQKPKHKYKEDINILLQQLDPIVDENSVEKVLPNNPELVLIHAETEKHGEAINFYSERSSNEASGKGLKRMCMSIMAEFNQSPKILPPKMRRNKKSRKSKMPQHFITPSKLPSIRVGHEVINTKEKSGLELWENLSRHQEAFISFPLALGQTLDLQLHSCPPTILSVNTFHDFQSHLYCGVPLAIDAKILHGRRVKVSWFVNSKLVESDSVTYTPSSADIGHKVQIVVSTVPSYESEAYEFKHPIEPLPNLPIVQSRRSWIESPSTSNRVRVLTYNLLADQYAKQLAPDHYANGIVGRSRRMPLLIYEILSNQADIICLQEVDTIIYESLYLPILEAKGYEGYFAAKIGSKEGLAMFWSAEKFECLEGKERVTAPLNDILLREDCKGWDAHLDLLTQLPRIRRRLGELGQIMQCVQLVSNSDPSKKLIIVNTHLYYHPEGDHIRALQTYGLCKKIVELQAGELSIPILLCGDLNSDPESGASQLLRHGRIDVTADVWENLLSHPKPRVSKRKSNMEGHASEQNIVPPNLVLPLTFPKLRPSGNPTFTHCIPEFKGVLDYILASSPLYCATTAPMPTIAEYMPNAGMPSDHISLVAEYEMKRED